MRIRSIRLHNLNSLVGTWFIDFDAPEYSSSGIFAITGPTGAGKSTILDAVCLALFGSTPRLTKVTKASNEIMSRQTGSCFAEVEFETIKGRYRCHWGQHRARRSSAGELQPPRHEIVDAISGKVLETKLREVVRMVEKVTGMDFDRFTRSMLLAQGGFAAFLEAEGDQRAPLLEQITGTEIYSRISIKVHERTTEERKKTELLETRLGTMELLAPEEEAGLTKRVEANSQAARGLEQHNGELQAALEWHKSLTRLTGLLGSTELELREFHKRYELAGKELATLDRALRAQPLQSDFVQLNSLIKQETLGKEQLKQYGQDIAGLRETYLTVREARVQAQQRLDELLQGLVIEKETIKEVRALDIRIHESRKNRQLHAAKLEEQKQEQHGHKEKRAALLEELEAIVLKRQQVILYLQEHGDDHELVEQLAGLRQQVSQLEGLHRHLVAIGRQYDAVVAAVNKAQHKVAGEGESFARVEQHAAVLRQRLEQRMAEINRNLDGRDPGSWRQEIAQAEQRRHQLEKIKVLLERSAVIHGQNQTAQVRLQALVGKQENADTRVLAREKEKLVQQELVHQLELNQQLSLRINSLEEERRNLVAGQPCPLCGAGEHPWAEQLPPVKDVGNTLVEARKKLEAKVAAIATLREELAALAREQQYLTESLTAGKGEHEQLEQQLAQLLVGSDFIGDPVELNINRVTLMLGEVGQQAKLAGDVLTRVEQGEHEKRKVTVEFEQALEQKARLQQTVQAAGHDYGAATKEQARLDVLIETTKEQCEALRLELAEQLQPFGIVSFGIDQAGVVMKELGQRQQAWKKKVEGKEQLERRAGLTRTAVERESTIVEQLDRTLVNVAQALATSEAELVELEQTRKGQYGDKQPDLEEQKLDRNKSRAEKDLRAVGEHCATLEKQIYGLEEKKRFLEQALHKQRIAVEEQQGRLLDNIQNAGFSDIAVFKEALLPQDQLEPLCRLRETLEKEKAELSVRKRELGAALKAEQDKALTEQLPVELEQELLKVSTATQQLQQQIGADKERLQKNNTQKKRLQNQQTALDVQRKELERWQRLHQLIGSADGKKFRVFAQGLTFDLMISHANQQLRKMNDRYILVRNPDEALELQVIDNYQAGEIRSTRNLSGGESFIVSLALSLGLSSMASRNVRVDSLFLDEGFGTLDEEALDTALQTLSELHQEGKLIGIISHVPLLKERIDVRIQVERGLNGRSRLVGPGCKAVEEKAEGA